MVFIIMTIVLSYNGPTPNKRNQEKILREAREKGTALNTEQIAAIVRNNPNYKTGDTVCFGSCWSGASGTAQQLANELDTSVYAPTRPVAWDPKENKWIMDTEVEGIEIKNPEIKPEWKKFEPE